MATQKAKKEATWGVYEDGKLIRTFAPGWNSGHAENPDMTPEEGAKASVEHIAPQFPKRSYEAKIVKGSDDE